LISVTEFPHSWGQNSIVSISSDAPDCRSILLRSSESMDPPPRMTGLWSSGPTRTGILPLHPNSALSEILISQHQHVALPPGTRYDGPQLFNSFYWPINR